MSLLKYYNKAASVSKEKSNYLTVFYSIKQAFIHWHLHIFFIFFLWAVTAHYIFDYHNLKLVVSTSGNIYEGIPPTKKSQTSAKLFEYSSIASLNKNVLLAACLEDSLLAKINIINGDQNINYNIFKDFLANNLISIYFLA